MFLWVTFVDINSLDFMKNVFEFNESYWYTLGKLENTREFSAQQNCFNWSS